MSENTDIIESIQRKIATELLPAVKAAEMDQVDLEGEMLDIPQQAKARLKQKVNTHLVSCRTLLNQIQV